MSKNIALFIDGTNNKCVDPKRVESTNVCKLFDAASETASQLKRYVRGVGVGSRRISGMVGGAGTRDRIQEAYAFLSENYRPSDNVYLFGFSRGALAARSLAGFADTVGLLLGKEKLEYVDEAYALYEDGMDGEHSRLRKLLRKMTGRERPNSEEGTTLPIYFIGVWDTVAALGLPGRGRHLSAPFTAYHQMELPSNVRYARHALSLHELRRSFEPLLWTGTSPRNPDQSLRQVWFAGAHADVGGGYDKTEWSDIARDWMTEEATSVGFQMAKQFPPRTQAWTAALHHQIKGFFRGSVPTVRQVLTKRGSLNPDTTKTFEVHGSVVQRLLTQGATKYSFRDRVDTKLRDADEISLQLFLEILFSGSVIATENERWWTDATVAEAAGAWGAIEAFVDGRVDDEQSSDGFTRALSLLLLLDEESQPLKRILSRVEENDDAKLALILPEPREREAEMDAFRLKLWAVVEGVEACGPLLPERQREAVMKAREALGDEYQRVVGEYSVACIRQHFKRWSFSQSKSDR